MDEINAFFDLSKPTERKPAPRGYISGNRRAAASPEISTRPMKREFIGTEWSKDVIAEEKVKMDATFSGDFRSNKSVASSHLEDLESESESDDDVVETAVPSRVSAKEAAYYKKFNFDLKRDTKLSIYPKREEVLAAIRNHPVVLLQGDTGCGKTTQVPQYILDEACKRQEFCNIICTQPRRIAAISIANRVSEERKWPVGSVVGYKVGLNQKVSDDTRLLYCTTGVLLETLVHTKILSQFTHIILDEVHERDQDMEFLLIIIRRLLSTNSPNVKIILMSATVNAKQFAEYFSIRNKPAPIIDVSGVRKYSVRDYYLDDLYSIMTEPVEVQYNEPGISTYMYHMALKLIMVTDNIERDEAGGSPTKGAILMFLPGINEINELMHMVENINEIMKFDREILVHPIRLHSMISASEQVRVFQPPPTNYRKVILATNIAESSITVPDVKYVIDFCLTKYLVADSSTNISSLKLEWASQSNCKQRAGRAGRVQNGRVYRLVPKSMYMHYFSEFSVPEMLRCPLDRSVLKAKQLNMDTPGNILALAMSPPNLSDILNTILRLKEVAALYQHVHGEYCHDDGDMTFMGQVMASIPLDIRLTRLVVLGYVYSVLEDAIIIAAGLSVDNIFESNTDRHRDNVDDFIQKLVWADGSGSDLFAIMRAFRVWTTMREQHNMTDHRGETYWAKRYHVNLRGMREMNVLIQEIKERLKKFGLVSYPVHQRVKWLPREKTIILKIIIAGAFYPNYFVTQKYHNLEMERKMYQTLCGNDPCNTVYFTNFDSRQLGPLYAKHVKKMFEVIHIPAKNIEVRFQPGSERVFVTFKEDPEDDEQTNGSNSLIVPGRVRPEVYKALKMRSMPSSKKELPVMRPADDEKYAQQHQLCDIVNGCVKIRKQRAPEFEKTILPHVYDKIVAGNISHIESCGEFYFQPLQALSRLKYIQGMLNADGAVDGLQFRDPKDVLKDMVVLAPMDDMYCRAKVLKVLFSVGQRIQFKVRFIDYGNVACVDFKVLRKFAAKFVDIHTLPPPMFQCRLALVQPWSIQSPKDVWPQDANRRLEALAAKGPVEIEVYSVVAAVANVLIPHSDELTFNDLLVEHSLARRSEENYMSKIDHDLRLRRQAVPARYRRGDPASEYLDYLDTVVNEVDVEVEPPPLECCVRSIKLRGPFSPLDSKLFSPIRIGAWKSVSVANESVLSDVIDTDPQDVHERFIVSSAITESQTGQSIIARRNTLMPNIPGFGALMTLLFCPTMQLKLNKTGSQYASVLAGLGYDEHSYNRQTNTYKSLFEEHDVVLHLDVQLQADDVELINELRYSMNTMLYCEPGEFTLSVSEKTRADFAAKIKNILVRLLNKDRSYVETSSGPSQILWERQNSDAIIHPMIYEDVPMFPMHNVLRLNAENAERKHLLRKHCEELHHLRQLDSLRETKCRLCNQHVDNVVELRVHMLSQLHLDREKQIGFRKSGA